MLARPNQQLHVQMRRPGSCMYPKIFLLNINMYDPFFPSSSSTQKIEFNRHGSKKLQEVLTNVAVVGELGRKRH